MSSGHDRRDARRLIAAHQAAQTPHPAASPAPAFHPAPPPAIDQHPSLPPLDVAALTASLEPSQTEAARYKTRPRPEVQIPRGPERQQTVVVVATELLKALIGKLGREALCTEDVHDCVDSAQELITAAAR